MKKLFFINPWFRSFIPLLLLAIAAISNDSLVVEISKGNEILWMTMFQKISFYVLCISTTLLCIYQIQISRYDNNFMKGITSKQFEATVRNKVAEDVAIRSKKRVIVKCGVWSHDQAAFL